MFIVLMKLFILLQHFNKLLNSLCFGIRQYTQSLSQFVSAWSTNCSYVSEQFWLVIFSNIFMNLNLLYQMVFLRGNQVSNFRNKTTRSIYLYFE